MNPETYSDVLEQNPDMPDELRGHVTRLASEAGEPSLEPQAALLPADIQHSRSPRRRSKGMVGSIRGIAKNVLGGEITDQEYDGYALDNIVSGIRAFADGESRDLEKSDKYSYTSWADMTNTAMDYVRNAPTLQEKRHRLSRFIEGVSYLWEGSHSSSGAEEGQTTMRTIDVLEKLRFDDDLMPEARELYLNDRDPGAKGLRSMLVQLQGRSVENPDGDDWYSMAFLGSVYDEGMVGLYKRSRQLTDPTLFKLFNSEGIKSRVAYQEFYKQFNSLGSFTPPEAANIQRETAQHLLRELAPNLPGHVAQDLLFAAERRTEPHDIRDYKHRADLLYTMLDETIANTDQLGRTAVERLREHAGIVNFDYYQADQLEMMNKVIEYDEATLEHLSEGDLTVVFMDASGDHNGVLKAESSTFRKPSGRTLFFEVHEPEDYAKYKAFLRMRDLKPSMIVFSGHGSPGSLALGRHGGEVKNWRVISETRKKGDEEITEEVVTEVDERRRGHSVTNEQGRLTFSYWEREKFPLVSVVGDLASYMQLSRGIDDPPEFTGYAQVILNACNQDSAIPHDKSKPGREPLTETVAEAIGPGVIVYGGNAEIDVVPTEDGFYMTGGETRPDGSYNDLGRIPIAAVQIGVDGRIYRTTVNEIKLRKSKRTK